MLIGTLVQFCGAPDFYISIYMIKPENMNNCHPQLNVVLERMSETNIPQKFPGCHRHRIVRLYAANN